MKKRLFPIIALLLSLMLVFSACGAKTTEPDAPAPDKPADTTPADKPADEPAADTSPIKFYLAAPMTGDSASLGIQHKDAIQVAIDEINAAGGVNGRMMEFEVADDQANANQANIVAEKIIGDDSVLFVLGHNNSGCSLSALPTYEKVNMPVISPTNTHPTICEEGYNNYFRIIATDALSASQQVKMGILELGGTTPAIIWENTDYGMGLREVAMETLDELGVELAGDESYVPGVDRDYSAQVTKFKGAGVDVVFFMGEYTAAALFAKQNVSLGLNAKIIGANGTSNEKLIEIGGEDVEGMYCMTSFNPYDTNPKIASFVEKYGKATNGGVPGEWGAHSYDIVYLVKAAIEAGATDRQSLIDTLHGLKGFEGVTGLIEFDEKGDVPGKKVAIMFVKDGTFEAYNPTKF